MHNLIDRADKLLTLKETKKENQKKSSDHLLNEA